MFLYQLHLDNYRGVRKARLTFDSTTVLIGENDCGKSTLMDALATVLDINGSSALPVFSAHDFHYPAGSGNPAGPLRIKLVFRERFKREWSAASHAPVAALLPSPGRQLRQLIAQWTAEPVSSGKAVSSWRLGTPGLKQARSEPELLGWLRQRVPAIYLPGGVLTGHGLHSAAARPPPARAAAWPAELVPLVERIASSAQRLLSGSSIDAGRDLELGFAAAEAFVDFYTRQTPAADASMLRMLGEILGKDLGMNRKRQPAAGGPLDSSAERMGVLLLIAALLRAFPEGLRPHMEPLWLVEDPEAHLHLMTLTSVILLLEKIRWQKVVTTYSGELLAGVPLQQVRRLVRHRGTVREFRVRRNALSREDLRRFGYHLRAHHGEATQARLWLLVEGESEYWILPHLARLLGYEFALEGISCIEFAQSGLAPLIKTARELGIEWHILADGDRAGRVYIDTAKKYVAVDDEAERLTVLREPDIEHCFWHNGYAGLYAKHGGISPSQARQSRPSRVIQRAVKRRSKPYLALSVVEAVAAPDSPGVPPVLIELIERCIRIARAAPARMTRDGSR